jgi:hypothetical protein
MFFQLVNVPENYSPVEKYEIVWEMLAEHYRKYYNK